LNIANEILIIFLCSIWWMQKLAQKTDGERFNLRKLNELEVRKEHQIEISNRFASFGELK